jgi:hypothetical protein
VFEHIPHELRSSVPGIAGSALALFFMRRPPWTLAGIFLGGCLLAYFGTKWVSVVAGMESADGLVGFLLGLFGMALLAKVHDTIEAIEPIEVWKAIKEFLRKRLGLGEEQSK